MSIPQHQRAYCNIKNTYMMFMKMATVDGSFLVLQHDKMMILKESLVIALLQCMKNKQLAR